MTNKSVAQICAIAAVVVMPSLSWAGTTSKNVSAPKAASEKLNESAITGDIGLNVVTAYYFRGIIQNNHAPSLQPYADIFIKAYEGDGFLNKAVFGLGVWESYTDGSTKALVNGVPSAGAKYWDNGRSNGRANWYESDVVPSLALTFGKVTITESYLYYSSPNDQFANFQGLNSKLSYDDSDLLGAFALHPSVTMLHEVDGKAGNGNRRGNYWEGAVTPGYSAGPVTITVPLTVGFGSSKYYLKDGYGYFSAGLNAAYALPVSKTYGTWTANLGGTVYTLDKDVVGGNASSDVVGQAGLGVAF